MYDKAYYQKHEDGSYQSALLILSYIKQYLDIDSVVDFGCGMGTWGKAIEKIGISSYIGIDQHEYDSNYMLIPQESYMQYDLKNKFKNQLHTDLAISVEVAEHVDTDYSEIFVQNICSVSPIVLFSAALPYQGGTGHINEKPCSFWAELFNLQGYKAIDCIRPHFWDDSRLEIWYRNNCLLYVRNDVYEKNRSRIPYEEYPLDIIHPSMLYRILKKRGGLNEC